MPAWGKLTLVPGSLPTTASEQAFDDGLQGRYRLSVGAVLREAWRLTRGVKRVFLAALLIFSLYGLLINFLIGTYRAEPISLVQGLLLALGYAPLVGGFAMLAARRAAGLPVALATLFAYTNATLPIALVSMVLATLNWLADLVLPFAASVAFSSLLAIFSAMTVYLIADRKMGPFAALAASLQASAHKALTLVSLFVVIILIVALSALPLGLGLIWTLPMTSLALGVVYREMFGVHEALAEG